jgi:radical SAM superfamily enzyme YgiQ (UPF0313 family)
MGGLRYPEMLTERVGDMRIVLVNPAVRSSFWTFQEASELLTRPGYMANLALPTLAALTPDDIEVEVVDEAVEAIDFDVECDIVGITGYVTHAARLFEIATEFRRRGRLVVIGGPYATLSSSTVRPYADVLFTGEAEETWPRFLADFRAGHWQDHYAADGAVDYASSPPPRVGFMSADRYLVGVVQTSRGCPFACEFCDVIVYLGRRQRHKEPEQVVGELETLHGAGYRRVFLSDDNFTANRRQARALLTAVADWNGTKAEPVSLATQMSIDVANDRDQPLLDLCSRAGMDIALIGIETSSLEALRDVKKKQNTHHDLVASVQRVHRSGILVLAGMIVGFDTDTVECFAAQEEFLRQAGLPIASLGMLNAPEGTPLEARLRAAGRLDENPVDDLYVTTNVVPLLMTPAELRAGTVWLLNRLYAPDAFLERVARCAADLADHGGPPLERDEGLQWYQELRGAYRGLGDHRYARLPLEVTRLLRGKDPAHIGYLLLYYFNAVRLLRRWGVWDPALAEQPAPHLPAREVGVRVGNGLARSSS